MSLCKNSAWGLKAAKKSSTELNEIVQKHETETKDLESDLDKQKAVHLEQEEIIDKLKSELNDAEERVNINNRKHRAVNKDLKKQLAGERKRAESLEERLTQLLAVDSNRSPGSSKPGE